jgi:hypothetical protein
MIPRGSVRRADRIVVLWMPIYWTGEVRYIIQHNSQIYSGCQRLKVVVVCLFPGQCRVLFYNAVIVRCNQTVSDSRLLSKPQLPVPSPVSLLCMYISRLRSSRAHVHHRPLTAYLRFELAAYPVYSIIPLLHF